MTMLGYIAGAAALGFVCMCPERGGQGNSLSRPPLHHMDNTVTQTVPLRGNLDFSGPPDLSVFGMWEEAQQTLEGDMQTQHRSQLN